MKENGRSTYPHFWFSSSACNGIKTAGAETPPHNGTSIPEQCVCLKTSSPIILLVYLLTLHLSYRGPMDFRSIGTVVD